MKKYFCVAVIAATTLSACTSKKHETTVTPIPSPAESAVQQKSFLKTNPADTPYLLYQLLAANPTNVNLSPLSLNMAFAQVYVGSNGKTKELLQQIFGFKDDGFSFKSEFQLAKEVEKSETAKLYLANSVWVRNDELKNVLPSFKQVVADEVDADLYPLAVKPLNEWVAKATHDKIKTLVDQISKSDLAYFVNAIYLKADWKSPFKKESTHSDTFRSSPHAVMKTDMMVQTSKFGYYEDDLSQWVSMPYRDLPLEMVLALPKKELNLKAVEDRLSAESMDKVLKGLKEENVEITLPKFKFDTKLSLKKIFTDAGFEQLFKGGDYSKFVSNSKNFQIADVIQATAIQVDEKGTEAAAATAVVMERTSLVQMSKKTFKADQPFLFLIRNSKSGEIYFLGRVLDPRN